MTNNCRIKYDIRVRSPFIWWFAYVRPFRVWFKRKKIQPEKKINFMCGRQRREKESAAKFISIIFKFQLNCHNRSTSTLQAIAFDSSFYSILSLERKWVFVSTRVNPTPHWFYACSLARTHAHRGLYSRYTNWVESSMHVAFNIFIGYIRQRRRRTQLDSESIGQQHTQNTLSHTHIRLHNLVDSVKQWHWSHKLI